MQQQQQSHNKRQRLFTASEVAEFEYCPLVWWHQQYEPLADADKEEHENGTQAPGLPEYQMVEQLLVRKGAFDEGRQQHQEHAKEVEEIQEELVVAARRSGNMRILGLVAAVFLVLAVLLIVAAILLR